MKASAKLFGRPINFAVVQLPQREFPGVVIQGDTLNGIVSQLERMDNLLRMNKTEELSTELKILQGQFVEARTYLEHICAQEGLALPY